MGIARLAQTPPPRLNGQGGPFFLEVKNSGLNA